MKHASAMPHAFTEQGVAMLSAVLRSPTAPRGGLVVVINPSLKRAALDKKGPFRYP